MIQRYVVDPQSLRKVEHDTQMSPWDVLVTPYDEAVAAVDRVRKDELERVTSIIQDYYKVAPKAAEPLLKLIGST